jgi:hypothetical protein
MKEACTLPALALSWRVSFLSFVLLETDPETPAVCFRGNNNIGNFSSNYNPFIARDREKEKRPRKRPFLLVSSDLFLDEH